MTSYANSNLLTLALEVNRLTSGIVAHLASEKHPEPNFSISSSDVPTTAEYDSLRGSLNDAALDLLRLVNGPKSHFREFFCVHNDLAAYQVAFDFNFFDAVPEKGSIELSALADKVGIDSNRVGRLMRLLCTQHVFEEISENVFAHTSQSILFVRDRQLRDAAHYQLDEMFKAASDTAASVRKDPLVSDAVHSPFTMRHSMPLFKLYQENPQLAARFASAMAGVARLDGHTTEIRDGFPWTELKEATVVDMGGGSGHVSIALARAFPNLEIIVQDASVDMLAQAQKLDLSDLNGRVTFMQHNFFDIQPVSDVGAYFIRQCMHNWTDEQCVAILKGLVPAMQNCKPGTPLLINDIIIPRPGTRTRFEEHSLRQMDMLMLVALGAKQRTEMEFRQLLEKADPRFEIARIHSEGVMGLLEVHLRTEQATEANGEPNGVQTVI